MYSFIYFIVVVISILFCFNEIIADLNIERDAKLSTVNIFYNFLLDITLLKNLYQLFIFCL